MRDVYLTMFLDSRRSGGGGGENLGIFASEAYWGIQFLLISNLKTCACFTMPRLAVKTDKAFFLKQ